MPRRLEWCLLSTMLCIATSLVCWVCWPLHLFACSLAAVQLILQPNATTAKSKSDAAEPAGFPSREVRLRYLEGRQLQRQTASETRNQLSTFAQASMKFDNPFLFRCHETYRCRTQQGSCSLTLSVAQHERGGARQAAFMRESYLSNPQFLESMRNLDSMCSAATWTRKLELVVIIGDIPPPCGTALPVFTKARRVATRCGTLLPLNQARHWLDILPTPQTLVPWAQKLERLVWRGSPNGNVRRRFVHNLSAQGHDVAWASFTFKFGSIDPSKNTIAAKARELWAAWRRTEEEKALPLLRRQLMGFKYVLSLEGNDVATDLKWLMAHNSVIFMPTPRAESWLMEGLLQPWVHYVPLDSPAHAAQRLEWARAHDTECQQIVANANVWVRRVLADINTLPQQLLRRNSVARALEDTST